MGVELSLGLLLDLELELSNEQVELSTKTFS